MRELVDLQSLLSRWLLHRISLASRWLALKSRTRLALNGAMPTKNTRQQQWGKTQHVRDPISFGHLETTPGPHWYQRTVGQHLLSTEDRPRILQKYLARMNKSNAPRCSCRAIQSPEHLLFSCKWFRPERTMLKQELEENDPSLSLLLQTNVGVAVTLRFLERMKVTTRKWQLVQDEED